MEWDGIEHTEYIELETPRFFKGGKLNSNLRFIP